jgi:hypothetical protein
MGIDSMKGWYFCTDASNYSGIINMIFLKCARTINNMLSILHFIQASLDSCLLKLCGFLAEGRQRQLQFTADNQKPDF